MFLKGPWSILNSVCQHLASTMQLFCQAARLSIVHSVQHLGSWPRAVWTNFFKKWNCTKRALHQPLPPTPANLPPPPTTDFTSQGWTPWATALPNSGVTGERSPQHLPHQRTPLPGCHCQSYTVQPEISLVPNPCPSHGCHPNSKSGFTLVLRGGGKLSPGGLGKAIVLTWLKS